MNMGETKSDQLKAVLTVCRSMGLDIRYDPGHGNFIAMAWEDGLHSCNEEQARSMQEKIKEQTSRYPNLVCYCFNPFSTLVYAV